MPGHSRIGTIFELRVPYDKRDVASPLTIGFSHPPGGPTRSSPVLKAMDVARYRTKGDSRSTESRFAAMWSTPFNHQRHQWRGDSMLIPQRADLGRRSTRRFWHSWRFRRFGRRKPRFVCVTKSKPQGPDHRLRAAQSQHELVALEQYSKHLLPGEDEPLDRVRQLYFSASPGPGAREGREDLVREDVDRHDGVVAPGR